MANLKILIATDFSDHAEYALAQARRFGGEKAAYRLVHVMPLLMSNIHSPMLREKDRAAFSEADTKAVEETLKALRKLAEDHDVPADAVKLLHGSVGASVAHEADEWGADLVVVGGGDHSKLEKVFMGSKARSILQSAPTDVLVVRTAAPESGPPYSRILLASDFTEASTAAAHKVRRWAQTWDADVDLVHVVDPNLWWQGRADVPALTQLAEGVPSDSYQGVMKQMLDDFNESHFDGEAKTQLVLNHPVDGVLKTAEETHADIIVVGTHAPGFLERVFMGSVAYGVATHGRKDVLVVRHKKED